MVSSGGPFGDATGGASVGVGFSDTLLLVVSLIGFAMLAMTVYSIILIKTKTREEFEKQQVQQGELDYDELLNRADVSTLTRAQRRARAKNIMKQSRRIGTRGPDGEVHLSEQEKEQHISRKERQRLAKEMELKERRVNEEERRKQQKLQQSKARRLKEERLQQEAIQQQQLKKQRELEKKQQEQAEYEAWKTFESSTEEEGAERTIVTVRELVEELQTKRTMDLQELAERVRGVPLQKIEARLQQLVEERRLTGILDTTSHTFVYLTHLELVELAALATKECEFTVSQWTCLVNKYLTDKGYLV